MSSGRVVIVVFLDHQCCCQGAAALPCTCSKMSASIGVLNIKTRMRLKLVPNRPSRMMSLMASGAFCTTSSSGVEVAAARTRTIPLLSATIVGHEIGGARRPFLSGTVG